jgi:hypothetical protein
MTLFGPIHLIRSGKDFVLCSILEFEALMNDNIWQPFKSSALKSLLSQLHFFLWVQKLCLRFLLFLTKLLLQAGVSPPSDPALEEGITLPSQVWADPRGAWKRNWKRYPVTSCCRGKIHPYIVWWMEEKLVYGQGWRKGWVGGGKRRQSTCILPIYYPFLDYVALWSHQDDESLPSVVINQLFCFNSTFSCRYLSPSGTGTALSLLLRGLHQPTLGKATPNSLMFALNLSPNFL